MNASRSAEIESRALMLGRYAVSHTIGEGGQGRVYEAVDTKLNRSVAIKTRKDCINPAILEQEAITLAKLDHPGIIGILDIGTEPKVGVFIVTMLIRHAKTLLDSSSHPKSLRGTLEMFAAIAEALGHAHERGVVHGDLKYSNVLVDLGGVPRLSDFGMARNRSLPAEGSQRRDVLALLYMLHAMVTGRHISSRRFRDEPMLVNPTSLRRDLPSEIDSICAPITSHEGEQPEIGAKELAKRLSDLASTAFAEPSPLAYIWVIPDELTEAQGETQRHETTPALIQADPYPLFSSRGASKPKVEPSNELTRSKAPRTLIMAATVVVLTGMALVALAIMENKALVEKSYAELPARTEPASVGRNARNDQSKVQFASAYSEVSEPDSVVSAAKFFRKVRFRTEPEGAKICAWRMDPQTGCPDYRARFDVSTGTPARITLPSGIYWVIVTWVDGTFMEAIRTVPSIDEQPGPLGANHRTWLAGRNGVVDLPRIDYTPPMQTIEFQRVPIRSGYFTYLFPTRKPESLLFVKLEDESLPDPRWYLPEFFISTKPALECRLESSLDGKDQDTTTVDFRALDDNVPPAFVELAKKYDGNPVDLDRAIFAAEKMGLRIASVIECASYERSQGETPDRPKIRFAKNKSPRASFRDLEKFERVMEEQLKRIREAE